MILLHLRNGTTEKVDPKIYKSLHYINSKLIKNISRVSIIDGQGKRVDLPSTKNSLYYMWIEKLEKNNKIKGERFSMRSANIQISATLYYSDNRITVDVDDKGGVLS